MGSTPCMMLPPAAFGKEMPAALPSLMATPAVRRPIMQSAARSALSACVAGDVIDHSSVSVAAGTNAYFIGSPTWWLKWIKKH